MKTGHIIILVIIIIAVILGVSRNSAEIEPVDEMVSEIVEDVMNETETQEQQEVAVELADGVYAIDASASTLVYNGGKKIPGGDHSGIIPVTSGTFTVTNGQIVDGMINLDMQNSTGDGSGVIDHLHSEDFFDVENFPTASVKVEGVQPVSGNQVNITSSLTLKDVANLVSFPGAVRQEEGMITVSGEGVIDRTQWGINFGSENVFQDLGDAIIKDEVEITFTMVGELESETDLEQTSENIQTEDETQEE